MVKETVVFRQAFELQNPIQSYAWGSRTAIAGLLGRPTPSAAPQAEMWMGAHPKAPSRIFVDGAWQPLDRLIARFPEEILGPGVAARFGPRLPYLFKVLAAAEPLSIQAHPNLAQAREGFARENRAGIPIDAPVRNYRDDNHKPELICALSTFWAMNGFRSPGDIAVHLQSLCPVGLGETLTALAAAGPAAAIRRLFSSLMRLNENRRRAVVKEAVARAEKGVGEAAVCRWVTALGRRYPEDIGVLAPAFLNLVRLAPGEAMFLPAGRLHAYLEGTAVEIMANSDNVLRGGLTAKHVDVPELLRVLCFEGGNPGVMRLDGGHVGRFDTPAAEFSLWVLRIDGPHPWFSGDARRVEILLCTEGGGRLRVAGGRWVDFVRGTAILVPAAAGAYRIEGQTVVHRAALPEI
ncbi:MAG: mannose-6-phosphate isomerase, class I [Desulfosarcinaceae bacterium]